MAYTRKHITAQVFGFKRVKIKNAVIQTEDVNHIPGKDIIELYLKLNGSKDFEWQDINRSLKPSSIFKNISYIISQVFRFPFALIKVKRELNKLTRKKAIYNYSADPQFLYLRTDHWFNLTSGGSVGHVSYVIDELANLQVLKQVSSSDSLYNVTFEPLNILSPNYSKTGNIPHLPELYYNLELIKSRPQNGYNQIYQRYSKGNFYGVYLSQKLNIPIILEYNGSEIWVAKNWGNKRIAFGSLLERIENINLQLASSIVVVSQVLKEELVERGVDAHKVFVNPNGVNTDVYQPKERDEALLTQLNLKVPNIIGFIGTFGEWHGVKELAQSIIQFFESHPERKEDTKFLLIGDGNLKPEVEQIINDSPFSDLVIFTGRIKQNLGPNYLNLCTMLVSPHIGNPDGSKFFGSPTKLFEYMAMEKPIVASNLEQIGDILDHEQNALLTEPSNITQLAEAYNTLINSKELSSKIAKQARKDVLGKHTWKEHTSKTLAHINQLNKSN